MMTTRPLGEDDLYRRLEAQAIAFETHVHPPVFTVEEARSLRGALPGAHVKNLFVRDKKKSIWLVTVLEDREIDLKALRHRLGAKGNLSFGDPAMLMAVLGVVAGAVTPFGVINDRDGLAQVVLDAGILAYDRVNAHPLRNDRTTALAPDGLLRFLEAEGHPPLILDL